MDSGMFFSGGSPYSPEQFSSPRYKLEKCEIKHGRLCGMFSLSDLNQTKTTGLFGCFGLELKQKFVRLHGVLMIYPSFKRIIHLCPDGDIRGNTAVFPFFYAIRLFISY